MSENLDGTQRVKSRLTTCVERALHLGQRHLLWLLLASYAAAALIPGPGLALRHVTLDSPGSASGGVQLPQLMLAFLLFNAGLGSTLKNLRQLVTRPAPLLAGVLANAVLPTLFACAVAGGLAAWPNSQEVQGLLMGVALIGAMPIAGASTGWAQGSDGCLALSLGLVLASTLLSPAFTPLVLHSVEFVAHGEAAQALHALASHGSGGFVALSIVLPSLLGLAIRAIAGPERLRPLLPVLKVVNLLDLILLNYSNAASALPQAFLRPDWDFLALTLTLCVGLCVLAFSVGAWLARRLRVSAAERVSLMFGLGMNNNGAGLVLASVAFHRYPLAVLPIVFYNIVQQLTAGVVHALHRRRQALGA
jgi:BASS family bile acid:Na+ symporter